MNPVKSIYKSDSQLLKMNTLVTDISLEDHLAPITSKIKMEKCDINDSIQQINVANLQFSTEVKVEKFDDYVKEEEDYDDNDYYSLMQSKIDPGQQHIECLSKVMKIDSALEKYESIKNTVNFEDIKPDNCVENQSSRIQNKKRIKSKCNDISTITNKAHKLTSNQGNTENVLQNDMKKKIEDIDKEIKQETLEYEELLSNIFQESNHVRIVPNRIEPEKPTIKIEPVDEEIFENDLIQLDHTYADIVKKLDQDSVDLTDEESSVEYHVNMETHLNVTIKDEVTDQNPKRRKNPRIYECNKCGYKNYHKQYREHREVQCKPTRKYEHKEKKLIPHLCTKCGLVFESLKRYLIHFKNHQYAYLTCPHCLVIFNDMYNLRLHVNSHIRQNFVQLRLIEQNQSNPSKKFKKGYECKQCKETVDNADFFSHWETHVEIKDVVQDIVSDENDMVEMDADNKEIMQPHILKDVLNFLQTADHAMQIQPCVICHRNFKRKNERKRHIIEHLLLDAYARREVGKSNMLKCQICQEEFKKSDRYKRHMREHASLPIYRCELCDHTFSDSSNFAKHKKIHNLQVMFCDICKKKFLAKSSLIKHIEMHNNTIPITCQQCPKRVFYTQSAYNKHYSNHHLKNVMPVKCSMCVMKFKTVKEKWDHMWEVHKERKDIADCPVCNKSFRKFQDVKTHMKSSHNLKAKILKMKVLKTVVAKRNSQLRKREEQLEDPHSTKEQTMKMREKRLEHPLSTKERTMKMREERLEHPQSTKKQRMKMSEERLEHPHSIKEQTMEEHSSKQQLVNPHLKKEQSIKLHSKKEPFVNAHSPKEQLVKLHSTKKQEVPQAVIKSRLVKETFTKLFSVDEKFVNEQSIVRNHSKNDKWYTVVKIGKKYSNDLILKQQSGLKVTSGELLKEYPINDHLVKTHSIREQVVKKQLSKPRLPKEHLINQVSIKEEFTAGRAITKPVAQATSKIKLIRPVSQTTTKIKLIKPVAQTSTKIRLLKPLMPKPKAPNLQIVEEQFLTETSMKRQLIKSESGQYKFVVLNRIRK